MRRRATRSIASFGTTRAATTSSFPAFGRRCSSRSASTSPTTSGRRRSPRPSSESGSEARLAGRQKAEPECELDVLGSVREPQFLVDALLVRVHGLWTDHQTVPDFRRGVTLADETQDVAF